MVLSARLGLRVIVDRVVIAADRAIAGNAVQTLRRAGHVQRGGPQVVVGDQTKPAMRVGKAATMIAARTVVGLGLDQGGTGSAMIGVGPRSLPLRRRSRPVSLWWMRTARLLSCKRCVIKWLVGARKRIPEPTGDIGALFV